MRFICTGGGEPSVRNRTANTGCGDSTALLNCGFSFSFFFHKEQASSACSFHFEAEIFLKIKLDWSLVF